MHYPKENRVRDLWRRFENVGVRVKQIGETIASIGSPLRVHRFLSTAMASNSLFSVRRQSTLILRETVSQNHGMDQR
jgi:hypothetical protein